MTETAILKRTLLAIGKLANVRTWRNNTGMAWMGRTVRIHRAGKVIVNPGDVVIRDARPVQFGLKGSGDIIGIKALKITPAHVGLTIGQFVSVETKTQTGRQTEQQEKFGAMVSSLGGLYTVARDPDQAAEIIRGGE